MPLFLFEGISGKLITAVLRPGKRPTGKENAAIIKRVVRLLRKAWPENHIATKLYENIEYQSGSWQKAYRVVMKAEVTALGDNPRYIVTSLMDPNPEQLYADLYCARGQDENFIKAVKNDLASDRTSSHSFLGNHLRLFYSCAAYSLIHSLRENTLVHTELARAQPMTIITKLFKLAVRVTQYKDRIKLALSSSCPVKGLLARLTELLYLLPRPPAPA